MAEKSKKSWQRRTVSLFICLSVIWLIYSAGLNATAWYFARQMGQMRSNLGLQPTPLTDKSIAALNGDRIEKFGISFQVPWKDVTSDKGGNSVAILNFKDGAGLVIFDPVRAVDGVKIMRGTTPRQQKMMDEIFSNQELSSNYRWMAAATLARPSDVKWWASRTSNVRNGMLLMTKADDLMDDRSVIYKLEAGGLQGFQYGNPAVHPYRVQLDLFDASDRHYKFWIAGKTADRPIITQPQINGLVASLRGLGGAR